MKVGLTDAEAGSVSVVQWYEPNSKAITPLKLVSSSQHWPNLF